MSLDRLTTQEIADGLKELGIVGYTIRGKTIVGMANPPTDAEIIAAANASKSKRESKKNADDGLAVSRESAIESALDYIAGLADGPKAIKDYIAARDG